MKKILIVLVVLLVAGAGCYEKPDIISLSADRTTINPYDTITITCHVGGGKGPYIYQWEVDNVIQTLPEGMVFGPTFDFKAPLEQRNYIIECVVRNSEGSDRASILITVQQVSVLNLKASSGSDFILLEWENPSDFQSIEIYRDTNDYLTLDEPSSSPIASIIASNYIDESLSPNTTYYYSVYVQSNKGQMDAGQFVAAQTIQDPAFVYSNVYDVDSEIVENHMEINWTNPPDFFYRAMVVSSDEDISWIPTMGTTYSVGEQVETGVYVKYWGNDDFSRDPYVDDEIISVSDEKYFKIFACDYKLRFSPGVSISKSNWNRMITIGDTPAARAYHSLAYLGDRQALLFGGTDGHYYYNDTWIYYAEYKLWESVEATGNSPSARFGHALASAGEGNIMLFGGEDSTGLKSDTWIFDRSTKSWTKLTFSESPKPRKYHTLCNGGDGKIYLFGGYDERGENRNDLWSFDISTQTWVYLDPDGDYVNSRMLHAQSFIKSGKIVLMYGSNLEQFKNDVFIYDISTSTFTEIPITSDRPNYRNSFNINYLGGAKILIFGGFYHNEYNVNFSDTWIFDYSNNIFTEIEGTPGDLFARLAYGSCYIGDGDVLLFGGLNNYAQNVYFDDTWIFSSGQIDVDELTLPPDIPEAHDFDYKLNSDQEIQLTWVNPTTQFDKVLLVRSDNPITFDPVDETEYSLGEIVNPGEEVILKTDNNYSEAYYTDTSAVLSTLGEQKYYKIFVITEDIYYSDGEELVCSYERPENVIDPVFYRNLGIVHAKWKNPEDNYYKTLLLRSINPITWTPTDGTEYDTEFGAQTDVSGGDEVYVRYLGIDNYYSTPFRDNEILDESDIRYYTIYTYDSNINYSDAITVENQVFEKIQPSDSYIPSARYSHDMCFLGGGKSLLFGGLTSSMQDDTWIYHSISENWDEITNTGSTPTARANHALCYAGEGTALMFGGYGDAFLQDTWIYNSSQQQWNQYNSGEEDVKPSARYKHAIAWADNNKIVLFGGFDGTSPLNDTWIYDVSSKTWSQPSISGSSPPARFDHEMCFIEPSKVLLFGGTLGSRRNDTWVFDISSNSWTKLESFATTPENRDRFSLAYIGNKQAILFGGSGTYEDLEDLWIFDYSTTDWIEQDKTIWQSPDPLVSASFSYIGNGKVVLFGGREADEDYTNALWTFVSPLSPDDEMNYNQAPSGITDLVISFTGDVQLDYQNPTDVYYETIIIHADDRIDWTPEDGETYSLGTIPDTSLEVIYVGTAETYTHDFIPDLSSPSEAGYYVIHTYNSDYQYSDAVFSGDPFWFRQKNFLGTIYPPPIPSDGTPIKYHTLAYLSDGKAMLFGGFTTSYQDLTYTYEQGTDTWNPESPSGSIPDARGYFALSYIGDQQALLFGGYSGSKLNDTYLFDDSTPTPSWTHLTGSLDTPAARSDSAMAFAGNGKVLLFGGDGQTGVRDDTWIFDKSTQEWLEYNEATLRPLSRKGHAMCQGRENRIILFGGVDNIGNEYNDTWEYDVTSYTWQQINTSNEPQPRWRHQLVRLSSNYILLFGGKADEVFYSDVWILDLNDFRWKKYETQWKKPYPREGFGMTNITTNQALIVGGNYSDIILDDIWIFDFFNP